MLLISYYGYDFFLNLATCVNFINLLIATKPQYLELKYMKLKNIKLIILNLKIELNISKEYIFLFHSLIKKNNLIFPLKLVLPRISDYSVRVLKRNYYA